MATPIPALELSGTSPTGLPSAVPWTTVPAMTSPLLLGLDVQLQRGCPWVALDENGHLADCGWLDGTPSERLAHWRDLLVRLNPTRLHVGIDAPRQPLPAPRTVTWRKDRWTRSTKVSGKGLGRHAEIVIKALNLANPQWTPLVGQAPAWMQFGFDLFQSSEELGVTTHEVFPSAARHPSQLGRTYTSPFGLPPAFLEPGPKDALDAALAALTLYEHYERRGEAVGGGDGLGTILLPRPADYSNKSAVRHWPADDDA